MVRLLRPAIAPLHKQLNLLRENPSDQRLARIDAVRAFSNALEARREIMTHAKILEEGENYDARQNFRKGLATMTYDESFEILIGHEGGYVNHPSDPGGETKFGISKRAYPNVDIKNLTLDKARAIYKSDYWIASGCDDVDPVLAFHLFDAAVNSGVVQAKKWLQQALEVTADGMIGPQTRAAIERMDPYVLIIRYNGVRLRFMTDLRHWDNFGKGWARRIADNLRKVT